MLRVLRRRRGKQTGPCPGNNKIHQSTHTPTNKQKSRLKHAYRRARTHTHIDRWLLSLSSHLPRPRWIHYPLPRRRAEFAWWPAFGLVHIPHRQQHPRWPCCFRRWGWRLWICMYFTCGLNTKNKYTLRWLYAYMCILKHTHTLAYTQASMQTQSQPWIEMPAAGNISNAWKIYPIVATLSMHNWRIFRLTLTIEWFLCHSNYLWSLKL